MRTNLTIGVATAFMSALTIGPALGQEAEGEGRAPFDALTMSCADLASLDAEMGAGIIYYIAGYSDGQSTVLAASGPADPEAGSSQGGGTEDASGTGGGQSADVETTASEEVDQADNPAGDTSEGDEGGSTADAAEGGGGGSTGGLGISVEQVLAACAASPDSPASAVIKIARGAAQPEVDPQDDDPAAEGADGQDVGSGNAVVE